MPSTSTAWLAMLVKRTATLSSSVPSTNGVTQRQSSSAKKVAQCGAKTFDRAASSLNFGKARERRNRASNSSIASEPIG